MASGSLRLDIPTPFPTQLIPGPIARNPLHATIGPGISAGQLLGYALHLLFLYHLISIKNINTI